MTLFATALLSLLHLGALPTSSAGRDTLAQSRTEDQPPNIILMIGDGMGVSQLSSRLYYGPSEEAQFTRFPYVGLVRTRSSSHKITDSAAGATAYSCGKKTFNGAIGVGPDSTALETILETLASRGYATGLVSTSSITHATPASFYAHVDDRNKEFEIAEQLLSSPVDFFAGGGKRFFFERRDGRNLYPLLVDAGVELDTHALEAPSTWDPERRYGYLLARGGMPTMLEGRGDFLPQATEMALTYLEATAKPYFLMVEGSQIDWGGHANDGEYLITEMQDFDKTMGKVLDRVEANPRTLVLATADHECGGFTMASTEVEVPFQGKQRDYDSLRLTFSTGGHSSAMVPLMASGRGQEQFTGIMQNTAVHQKMLEILQISPER